MTSQRTRDRMVQRLRQKGIQDDRVLTAMGIMPRHLFVDEALATRAYEDDALPIGHGQTISQPYIVARMTEIILSDGMPDRVLEVGTGSGYQAAILSAVVKKVYSVERIVGLLRQARGRFNRLGIRNIVLKHSDGSWGWSEYAPYEAIVVTAAPEEVPESLLLQLTIGGKMVIPVGSKQENQRLMVIVREQEGFMCQELDDVRFVPMLHGAVNR